MKTWFKKLMTIMLGAALLITSFPSGVYAEVMYPTFTRDSFDSIIFTQPAYIPTSVIGVELEIEDPENPGVMLPSPLQSPKDVFVDNKDQVYIADSGNNRIVHLDENYDLVRYISLEDDPMNGPEGIFVNDEGHIYVADTGNKRVLHLDENGNLVKDIGRPGSRFIPDDFKYDPIKLVADKRGYLYVATLGGYRGLLQMDPDGNFQSFYGANLTKFTVLDALKRMLYTEEMYANEISKLPGSVNNVTVGPNGFIYTVTAGDVDEHQIKRLDIEGKNLLKTSDELTGTGSTLKFGEYIRPRYVSGRLLQPQLIDVAVDSYGNMTAIDKSYNFINQYDTYGNLLFFWGGQSSPSSSQMGLIKNPVAVDVNSKDELLILDDQEGLLQVFELSEFGEMVYRANELTNNGFYEQSEQYWRRVLDLNAQYAPAMLGLAKAAYKREEYEVSRELFKQAGDQVGYSDSFWQIRLKWFQDRFSIFATIFIIFAIVYLAGGRFIKRIPWVKRMKERRGESRFKFLDQMKHALYLLKHPIDGFTAIRYENKGSYWSALVILLGMYISLVINELYTSFSFNKVLESQVDAGSILVQFVIIWFAWVICNYLISSIYRGEGRFRDVFIGSAYALVPFIILSIPLAIISNAMTLSEEAIYQYILYGIYIWVGAMFFWKVQSLQNYGVGETVMNLLLSLFAMLVTGVLAFIIFGLTNELRMFIYEVYQEVLLR